MRSSTLLLLLLAQHSRRCRRKARRSRRQRPRRARKRQRKDGTDAGNQRDLSAGLPLDCIVSRLPLRQRAQMMCVCKAWYSILRDCVAADLGELQKEGPWLLMARYCRDTRSWKLMAHGKSGPPSPQVFSIPFRQENLCASNGSFQGLLMGCTCSECFPSFYTGQLLDADWRADFQQPRLASSGGLMCGLLSADPHHLKGVVVVFNCLTGSFKLLPPPLRSDLLFSRHCLYDMCYPYPCPCSIYMAVDDLDPTHYYIMLTRVEYVCWAYFQESERHMEVFDSKTGSWKVASFPVDWLEWGSVEDLLPSYVWDGDFFFIWEDDEYFHRDFTYVGAYNVARHAWSLRLVPHLIFSRKGILHKFRGRLFFAFTLRDCLGFRVCELLETLSEEAAVVEVACTPRQCLREIEFRLEQESKSCDSTGKWEVLAGGSCFCWFLRERVHEVPPLIFDLASNSWYLLREEEWLLGFYGALLYQPNLYARV